MRSWRACCTTCAGSFGADEVLKHRRAEHGLDDRCARGGVPGAVVYTRASRPPKPPRRVLRAPVAEAISRHTLGGAAHDRARRVPVRSRCHRAGSHLEGCRRSAPPGDDVARRGGRSRSSRATSTGYGRAAASRTRSCWPFTRRNVARRLVSPTDIALVASRRAAAGAGARSRTSPSTRWPPLVAFGAVLGAVHVARSLRHHDVLPSSASYLALVRIAPRRGRAPRRRPRCSCTARASARPPSTRSLQTCCSPTQRGRVSHGERRRRRRSAQALPRATRPRTDQLPARSELRRPRPA